MMTVIFDVSNRLNKRQIFQGEKLECINFLRTMYAKYDFTFELDMFEKYIPMDWIRTDFSNCDDFSVVCFDGNDLKNWIKHF